MNLECMNLECMNLECMSLEYIEVEDCVHPEEKTRHTQDRTCIHVYDHPDPALSRLLSTITLHQRGPSFLCCVGVRTLQCAPLVSCICI